MNKNNEAAERAAPCPWCGESPDVTKDENFQLTDGSKWGALRCCVVGPEVRTGYKGVSHWKQAAIEAWNERATLSPASGEAALEEQHAEGVAKLMASADRFNQSSSIACSAVQASHGAVAANADSAGLPTTAESVITMIGSHYRQQRTHTDAGARLPLDDVTYMLTVHDLLSAFSDWREFGVNADSAADARDAWISVEDRLPEVGQQVLVFTPNRKFGDTILFDTWDEQRECPVDFSTVSVPTGDGWNDHEFEEISHWQPLPKAPA